MFVQSAKALPIKIIDEASEFLNNVQRITFKNTDESVCDEILTRFLPVKSLIFSVSTPSPSKTFNLPNLEELELFESAKVLKSFEFNQNLKKLAILEHKNHRKFGTETPNAREEFSRILNNFLLTCESLKELTIGNAFYKFYDKIEDVKFNLEKLSLQGVIIEDEDFLKLLKSQ